VGLSGAASDCAAHVVGVCHSCSHVEVLIELGSFGPAGYLGARRRESCHARPRRHASLQLGDKLVCEMGCWLCCAGSLCGYLWVAGFVEPAVCVACCVGSCVLRSGPNALEAQIVCPRRAHVVFVTWANGPEFEC